MAPGMKRGIKLWCGAAAAVVAGAAVTALTQFGRLMLFDFGGFGSDWHLTTVMLEVAGGQSVLVLFTLAISALLWRYALRRRFAVPTGVVVLLLVLFALWLLVPRPDVADLGWAWVLGIALDSLNSIALPMLLGGWVLLSHRQDPAVALQAAARRSAPGIWTSSLGRLTLGLDGVCELERQEAEDWFGTWSATPEGGVDLSAETASPLGAARLVVSLRLHEDPTGATLTTLDGMVFRRDDSPADLGVIGEVEIVES